MKAEDADQLRIDAPEASEPVGEKRRTPQQRIRELELENSRLRRIVADRDLEIEMLREISRGTY